MVDETKQFDIASALNDVVAPVVSALFLPGEVDSISVARVGPKVVLSIIAVGEESMTYLWGADWSEAPIDETRQRVADELENFIAESRFAWGQQRVFEPRPVPEIHSDGDKTT